MNTSSMPTGEESGSLEFILTLSLRQGTRTLATEHRNLLLSLATCSSDQLSLVTESLIHSLGLELSSMLRTLTRSEPLELSGRRITLELRPDDSRR